MNKKAWIFRKYGKIFEDDEGLKTSSEPESPYESTPYVPPENRQLSSLEQEKLDLAELRIGGTSHWDS